MQELNIKFKQDPTSLKNGMNGMVYQQGRPVLSFTNNTEREIYEKILKNVNLKIVWEYIDDNLELSHEKIT